MSGLFPSICNGQNVDRNGRPFANAQLTVYLGGTTTLASCFQDIGLAIPGPNPMTADQTGRLPFFYVADGVYRVRLVDQTGVLIYDFPQAASIGASSSGGGGSAVDPTSVFSTGDELWKKIGGARAGWVRQNARTIGSATSGASERANTDCQALALYIWNNYPDAKCPVVGGRGATAAADWAANKQFTLPDMRGKGPHGLDGMGNSRANVIPDGNVTSSGDTADTDAASGGEANHTLITNELASHSHNTLAHTHSGTTAVAGSHNHGGAAAAAGGHSHTGTTDNGGVDHTHNFLYASIQNGGFTGPGGSGWANQVNANTGSASAFLHTHTFTTASVADHTHVISTDGNHTHTFTTDGGNAGGTSSAGGGVAHNNMSPFSLGTWYLKL